MNRREGNGWNNPLQTFALKWFNHRTLHVKKSKRECNIITLLSKKIASKNFNS